MAATRLRLFRSERVRALQLLLLCLGLPTVSLRRPDVPTIVLGKEAETVALPLQSVEELVELPDGRAVVFHTAERFPALIDFANGAVEWLTDSTTSETALPVPGRLLKGFGHEIAFFGSATRRLLLLSPSGSVRRSLVIGDSRIESIANPLTPMAIDALGRVYGQTMGTKVPIPNFDPRRHDSAGLERIAQRGVPQLLDSVEIQRAVLGEMETSMGVPAFKTIARIRNPLARMRSRSVRTDSGIRIISEAPNFFASDLWTLLPDGRIGIIRDGVYRVHFVTPMIGETIGPTLPYEPVPVTLADRHEAVAAARALARRPQRSVSLSAGGGVIELEVIEPASWAEFKPAVQVFSASPDGRLWAMVTRSTDSKLPPWDLLDDSGALLARVAVPEGERVVGFGSGALFTVRSDNDGLRLLRHAIPELSR
jgi:hypothetical protein